MLGFGGKPGGNKPLERFRWKDNIKIVLKKYVCWEGLVYQVQDKGKSGAVVNAVMVI
jgi:hypothetical protein